MGQDLCLPLKKSKISNVKFSKIGARLATSEPAYTIKIVSNCGFVLLLAGEITWIKLIFFFNKVGKSAVFKFDCVYILQQFGYEINSRTLLNGTYCTQCGELLIAFCKGNLTQNSWVEK